MKNELNTCQSFIRSIQALNRQWSGSQMELQECVKLVKLFNRAQQSLALLLTSSHSEYAFHVLNASRTVFQILSSAYLQRLKDSINFIVVVLK